MAIANTASLTTDFNVDPYYDDFEEGKNFHRILYRPGLAVQARELTQMQTIQQNQLDRLAEHVFVEGSTVRGLEMNYDKKIDYVKIRDNDQNGASVNAAAFVGSLITGGTTGMTAIVYDSLEGTETSTNTKTLYIKYQNAGANNTTRKFASAEVLNSNTSLSANVITGSADIVANKGARVTMGSGVIYAKDHFIRVDEQSLVIGRYSRTPTVKVGYDITESIVTSASDSTLLDPAQGAYNYAAPGANRLKLTATLVSKEITDTATSNFIEKFRTKSGEVEFNGEKPMYSILNEYLARRTSDESGDYLVNGLNIRLREHLASGTNQGVYTVANGGDVNKLSADVAPGKAYVKGFELENHVTAHIDIDKGTDYESVEALPIPANYGNYTVVDNVVGTWDLNGHDRVELYDTKMNAIANNSISSLAPRGNKIGEARVRAVEYTSGTKGDAAGRYNLYLYDINMTANNFSYVRSVYYNDSTHDGFADTVLTGGNAVLNDTSFNRAIFRIPADNIKTLRDTGGSIDNTYRFLKEFGSLSIATNGTVTITTGAADEIFPFSTGALNSTQERENFYVVMRGTANSASPIDTGAARVAGSNTITGLTSVTTKYNIGDILQLQGEANTYVVSNLNNSTSVNVYGSGEGATLSSATVFKQFVPGQVISLNGVGGDASDRTVNINSATSATIDIQETLSSTIDASVYCELQKTDGQEIAKTINKNRYVEINVSDSGTTAGPWNLGLSDGHKLSEVRLKTGNSFFTTTSQGTDVTNDFEIDTGMRDNFYNHAKLKLKSTSSRAVANGDVYLVKFDYFTHDTSSGVGYFSVDSYPIDDANTANTTAIQTAEIPVYKSPTTGVQYDLRNHIDIRPRITDTANSVTTLTNISRNPATSTAIVEPSGGLRFMAPNENFTVDLDYYLPRKDRIVINSRAEIGVIKGVPSLNPQTPVPSGDGLTLAIIDIAPYPSLPFENAKRINTATSPNGRTDIANQLTPIRQVRFTMKDIGTLRQRIENLEYYTSLSLLESDAKSTFFADSSGADRFKNGLLVDPFTGHNIGDPTNPDYKIAVDPILNEARPTFKLDDVQLEFKSANSTNVTASPKDTLVTIAVSGTYSNGETITQGAASGTLKYQVGSRLYLENVSGTFTTSANVVGGTSSVTRAVSSVSAESEGNLIMLPWTHEQIVEQPFATDTRNTVGLFWSFRGHMTLTPDTDYWVDTVTRPEVQIDFDFNTQAWQNLANAWGTQFGDWNTIWTGNESVISTTLEFQQNGPRLIETVSSQSRQVRNGLAATIGAPTTNQISLGESVRDVNIIPFMRSRVIQVTTQGLKPSTRVYAFFDGEDVNAYCTPANSTFGSTGSEGDNLVTDSNGIIYLNFRIPNEESLRFRTGSKFFRLIDSQTNSTGTNAFTTHAEASYTAEGLSTTVQDTVISTRNVSLEFRSVNDTRTITNQTTRETAWDWGNNVDGDGGDPIAQTFTVDTSATATTGSGTGAFLTKIDLYFQSKTSGSDPMIIEIREVDPSTSYLTNRVVPFGRKILQPSDINISNDGTAPTPVIFNTPVYLLNATDYAFVCKPAAANPDYTVWTARMGQDDLITGNRVTQQPASGMLFASANDRTWTAFQEEDIKFKMYFGNFGTNQSGTAVMKNIDKEYFTLDTVDTGGFPRIGETIHGETTLNLSGAISANVGDIVVQANTSSAQANGIVTYNSGSTIRVKEVTTATKFTDSATIYKYAAGSGANTGTSATISSQSTPTGKTYLYDATTQSNTIIHLSEPSGLFSANTFIRGQSDGRDARIVSIDNLPVDTFHTHLSKIAPRSTTAAVTGKLATSASARDSSFRKIVDNGDTIYDNRRFVLSKTNETNNLSGEKSAELNIALTNTTNRFQSPAIDNDRAALFTVENLINNDSTGEDSTSGGNSLARYITRTITLADGQDAEDLRVIIGAYKPSTATIEVYYKILNREDGDTLDDHSWIQMTQVTSTTIVSDTEDQNDLNEYEYKIPDAQLTGGSGEVEYVNSAGVTYTGFKQFAIKIVLLSTSPSRVPRMRDFRAIALQI